MKCLFLTMLLISSAALADMNATVSCSLGELVPNSDPAKYVSVTQAVTVVVDKDNGSFSGGPVQFPVQSADGRFQGQIWIDNADYCKLTLLDTSENTKIVGLNMYTGTDAGATLQNWNPLTPGTPDDPTTSPTAILTWESESGGGNPEPSLLGKMAWSRSILHS